ncbi:hypothetical protein [Microbacterium sp. NPDC096154]|uniref:hypothetical protein n=1 Tax=Microbacterium sp. NPDC096154 TaxID=3155549 RepID=UPI00331D96A1
MVDIMLDRARLRATRNRLEKIIAEFKDAAETRDDLKEAVSTPHGKDKLRDRVDWFEDNWKSNREDLAERLEGVYKRLDGIVEHWAQWETDTSKSLEG